MIFCGAYFKYRNAKVVMHARKRAPEKLKCQTFFFLFFYFFFTSLHFCDAGMKGSSHEETQHPAHMCYIVKLGSLQTVEPEQDTEYGEKEHRIWDFIKNGGSLIEQMAVDA